MSDATFPNGGDSNLRLLATDMILGHRTSGTACSSHKKMSGSLPSIANGHKSSALRCKANPSGHESSTDQPSLSPLCNGSLLGDHRPLSLDYIMGIQDGCTAPGPLLVRAGVDDVIVRFEPDSDEVNEDSWYYVPHSRRLIVGKYVPDPTGTDISDPKRNGTVKRNNEDGTRRDSDYDNGSESDGDKAKKKRLSESDTIHSEEQLQQMATEREDIEKREMDWIERTPHLVTEIPLVDPVYPASSRAVFFPVTYGIATAKDKTDSRGSPSYINEALYGKDQDRKHVTTKFLMVQKDNLRKVPLYKIGPGAVAFRVVLNAVEAGGLQYTPSNEHFNLMWAKRATPEILAILNPYQKLNHFPGAWGVGRKDSLAKNIGRMRRIFGGAQYDIVPRSFLIPSEKDALQDDLNSYIVENGPDCTLPTYIVKPSASSCGKGIKLFSGMPVMPKGNKQMVCQRYLSNPFLVFGRKFDLRMYCCICGFDPLRIYLFDEGLVRFAAEKFPGADKMLKSVYAHLTNYSINKTSELVKASKGKSVDGEEAVDIKWAISDLKDWLQKTNGKTRGNEIWNRIYEGAKDVVIKTFLSIEDQVVSRIRSECKKTPTGSSCFELYGLDLMVDDEYRVSLIEVNIMPSLATGSTIDKAVKSRMLAHMLTLVGIVPHIRPDICTSDDDQFQYLPCAGNTNSDLNDEINVHSCKSPACYELETNSTWYSTERYFYPTYKGTATGPTSRTNVPLACRFSPSGPGSSGVATLSPGEQRMLFMCDEEVARSGGFDRIFPTTQAESYFPYFTSGLLRSNYLLASWEKMKESHRHSKTE